MHKQSKFSVNKWSLLASRMHIWLKQIAENGETKNDAASNLNCLKSSSFHTVQTATEISHVVGTKWYTNISNAVKEFLISCLHTLLDSFLLANERCFFFLEKKCAEKGYIARNFIMDLCRILTTSCLPLDL